MSSLSSLPPYCQPGPTELTGALAVVLAQGALQAGQSDNAARYLDIAYRLFDACAADLPTPVNASGPSNG